MAIRGSPRCGPRTSTEAPSATLCPVSRVAIAMQWRDATRHFLGLPLAEASAMKTTRWLTGWLFMSAVTLTAACGTDDDYVDDDDANWLDGKLDATSAVDVASTHLT